MTEIDRPRYMKQLEGYIDTPVAKVLTGMRRSGKSTLLTMLRKRLAARGIDDNRILHANFDNLGDETPRQADALYRFITKCMPNTGPFYVLFDEVQEVEGWEKVINSLLADGRADIYVTGSNSKLLSSELATHIAGRYASLAVAPLTFGEFVDFSRETNAKTNDIRALFNRFIVRGGLPGLFAAPYTDDQVRQLVTDIYSSILIRDILTHNTIRSSELFERVTLFALDNVGNLFSARRVSEFLKSQSKSLGHQAVADYLQALCDAFLLQKISRFDVRGRSYLATQEKYFAGDHGIVKAVLGYSLTRLPGILENIVSAELISRGFTVSVGKVGAAEIDFIATRQEERVYVQVSATIIDPATRRRELAPLQAVKDSYPKYVLTLDDIPVSIEDGIRIVSLPDFLLGTL